MTSIILRVVIVIFTLAGMEAFSWFIHKYLFHGPLWFIHKSHHQQRHGWFELNDLFSFTFAAGALWLMWIDHITLGYRFWIGSGVSIYGVLYFTLHDWFIHNRVKAFKTNNKYLLAIRRAHKIHHKSIHKWPSQEFGLLMAENTFSQVAIKFRNSSNETHINMLQIQENVSLKNFNTFGIEAKAKYFVEINHEDDLVELFMDPQWLQTERLVIGGGSNMLFVKDFDGLVIRMNIRGIEHRIQHEDVFVEAGAGEVWNDLVNFCVTRQYAGLENLSLIPGSVGASPIQNIGAYGVELKDVFKSCKAFEIATGKFKTFTKDDCRFAYRDSIFKTELKGRYIIVSVKFHLSMIPQINLKYGAIEQELQNRHITNPTIKDVSQVVSHIRVSKLPDPTTIGNAGSFFKNPVISTAQFNELLATFPDIVNFPAGSEEVKLAAGWLIEQCGWKGKVVGHTGTWKNQALVLVNHGDATGEEVYSLSSQIIDSVYTKFGVLLEREVNIIN